MHKRQDDVEDGFCGMHLGALFGGLALSLVELKVDKKVVNKWAPFLDLHKRLKDMCKYLLDKKNKCFPIYQKNQANMCTHVVIILVYTRVAGVLLLFQSAIRSMFGLRHYATQSTTFDAKSLNHDQWKQIVNSRL